MSTHKWIDRICVIVTVLSLIVTALFMNGERLGIGLVSDTDAEGYAGNEYFTANDLNGSWDTSEATAILLSGNSAAISGNGAYWLDGSLVIAQSGQYVISGELTDGNIVVDAAQYSKVWIQLNGVTVTCGDDACIRVDQADKVFLTIAEGTENTLTGGDAFSETALADGTNAVIFSHDDLTINGSGSLTVVSSCLNGITSKDDLIITGGTISVTAPNHGLRVNDHFRMTNAEVVIFAAQDGIHSEGDIVIQDGTLTVTAGDDAIHSDTSVRILGGTILVRDCYEGIEAVTIEIAGGDTTIHAQDDGINANGYTGGAFGGRAGMGGQMQEMSESPFPGGTIPFPGNLPGTSATENAEADGEAASEETSAQDAENTPAVQTPGEHAGREDMGTMMPFGEDPGAEWETQDDASQEQTIVGVEDTWILITGGSLTILNENGRDADGIDSNGNITMSGGTVLVSLIGSNGNSALDFASENGGVASISGGTIIACGDSSMAEEFGSESAQASIRCLLSEAAAAGSVIVLLDSEGKELISEEIPYSFSSAVISCPEMSVGETYTLRIGETEESIEVTGVSVTAGTASDTGMMPGGGRPVGGEMGPGSFGNGETPPELPEGAEGFHPPKNREGFGPPEGGFGPPEMTRDDSATEASDADEASASPEPQSVSEGTVTHETPAADPGRNGDDFTEKTALENGSEQTADANAAYAWMLVTGSVLLLALGLLGVLKYKNDQNIDA